MMDYRPSCEESLIADNPKGNHPCTSHPVGYVRERGSDTVMRHSTQFLLVLREESEWLKRYEGWPGWIVGFVQADDAPFRKQGQDGTWVRLHRLKRKGQKFLRSSRASSLESFLFRNL